MQSIRTLYKVGKGPSSSHTMGKQGIISIKYMSHCIFLVRL